MSVTGAKFFGEYMAYAAGAPRANEHGQVILFHKGIPPKNNPLTHIMTLEGEQIGSSFGYELISADINGDQLPDLIIGSPFFFDKDNGGAIYVYQNENYKLPETATLKITGKFESRFGIAMANIGDINKDKYEDIAVGAPFEDNIGTVYIFLGSQNGLSKTPVQTIRGNNLGLNTGVIRTFGSSISGGVDLDNNLYPDILIGAYGDGKVVALLARPIIKFKTMVESNELQNIDPSKRGCDGDKQSNLTCFSFKACCAIEAYESNGKQIDLEFTLEAETFNNNKKFSRVFFDHKDIRNIIKRNIKIEPNGEWNCQDQIVYIKNNTRDIQNAIKVIFIFF